MEVFRIGEHEFFAQQYAKLDGAIEEFRYKSISKNDIPDIRQRLIADFSLRPIELGEEIRGEREEETIKVTERVPFISTSNGPTALPQKGVRISIHVPYTGSKSLWNLQPQGYNLLKHEEFEVRDSEIVLSFEFTNKEVQEQRENQIIAKRIHALSQTLELQKAPVDIFNAEVIRRVSESLEAN